MKLLEIQSSVRLEKSISRALSHEFIEALQNSHMEEEIRQQEVVSARLKLMNLATSW